MTKEENIWILWGDHEDAINFKETIYNWNETETEVFKLALSSEREEARTPNIEEEKSAISTETNSSNILPETTPKVSTDEKCIDKANKVLKWPLSLEGKKQEHKTQNEEEKEEKERGKDKVKPSMKMMKGTKIPMARMIQENIQQKKEHELKQLWRNEIQTAKDKLESHCQVALFWKLQDGST